MKKDEVVISCRNVWKLFGEQPERFLSTLEENATYEDIREQGYIAGVHDVSVDVHRGEMLVIMGLSGSGKSTLVRCMGRLHEITGGTIEIEGEDIGALDEDALINLRRQKMGMVFQSFNLWSHMTVLQNVCEALVHVLEVPKAEAIERAEAVLCKVGMYDRREYYPAHISGGQQQRAAIARALAMEPEVMLFDEPTSALDPELVGEVLKVMRDLADEGRTMIVVTHEMNFARDVSSEVIFLHEGLIEAQGPPQQMFGNSESERFQQFLQRALN